MHKITTPKGEVLVILPLDEYERLVDHADVSQAHRVKADIAAGHDELVPAELVNRLLAGENPVRVWRSHCGFSARDLAARAGLSGRYISEIESGKKEGSVSAALKRIAEVLAVDLDDLV